ncbi:MAG: putative quinol monooxygenase [Candidatus Acidiferrum sp.]|jgi:quinol monooxygenase YgiN
MAKPKPKKKAAKPRKSRKAGSSKVPKDAVTLIVRLYPRDGQEMLLEAELRALVGPTRKEEGCLIYDLYRSAEPPIAFKLREVWASREHHMRHTNTPHFLRWNARKDALLASRDATFWKQVL